jgi:hypothetical protein
LNCPQPRPKPKPTYVAKPFDDVPKLKTRKTLMKGSCEYHAPYIPPSDSDEPLESYGNSDTGCGHAQEEDIYDTGVAEISGTMECMDIDSPLSGHASAGERGTSKV